MAETVTYTVMGREYAAERGTNLLNELRKYGYEVPSLCHHEALSPYGACRLCLVEVTKGKRTKLTTSCNYPVQQGIEVSLDTDRVVRNRKIILELLLAQAPKARQDLFELADQFGVHSVRFEPNQGEDCILCGLCTRTCTEAVGADALTFAGRGDQKRLGPPYTDASDCIGCGSCSRICPTGAIPMHDAGSKRTIWKRNFERMKCYECGAYTLTLEHVQMLMKRSNLDRSYFDFCDACRRRTIANRFKAVMG